jgi:pimeloyl-ACP methyl ester carboxylesterase
MPNTSFPVAGLLVAALSNPGIATRMPPQNVDIKAPDGVVLKATYYDAGKPGPAILMLHACNKDRWSWAPLANAAAARGFHLLALDYRGFGESGGDRFAPVPAQQAIIDNAWPVDVDAAFAWLTSRPQVDKTRVAAIGASCGVNQSVQLAKRHPSEVRTVVLLSGGVNESARLFLRDTPSLPVFAAASRGDSGAADEMRWLLGWSRNPANRFLEYKAAGHGTDMFGVEKGLEPAILDWFAANLMADGRTDVRPSGLGAASTKPSPAEAFWTMLTAPGGVAKARQAFDENRRAGKRDVLFPEGEMNRYGYQLLQGGNAKDALEVFKLNVDAYPSSANTHDSLSDAWLALGNREEALKHAGKALEILPKDPEASEELKALVRESAERKIRGSR